MDRISLINSSPELIELGEKRFKKQILRKGEWEYGGSKLSITQEKLERIKKNFEDRVIENLPIFRGHASQKEAEQNPNIVAGYIESLEIDGNGLNAVMSVDDRAVGDVGKIYKNVSVALDEAYKDHETGEFKGDVLRHVALVIEPYLKRLNPEFIALSEDEDKEIVEFNLNEDVDMAKKKKAEAVVEVENIEVPEAEVVETEVVEEVKTEPVMDAEKQEIADSIQAASSPDLEPAPTDEGVAPAEGIVEDNKKDESTEEKKEEEVIEPVEEKVELSETEKRIKDLEEELAKSKEVERQTRKEKIDMEYTKLLSEGKVVPAQESAFKSIMASESLVLLSDGEEKSLVSLFAEFLEASPVVVEFGEKGFNSTDGSISQLSEQEKSAFDFMGYDKTKIEEYLEKKKSGKL